MANKEKGYWLPIDSWNLNEIFTTETISPISFYGIRNFGNKVSRSIEKAEGEHFIVLFKEKIQSDIILFVSEDALELKQGNSFEFDCKIQRNATKIEKLKSVAYHKTIYLRRGNFSIHFNSKQLLEQFRNNTFLLLEVKAISKYFDDSEKLGFVFCENNEHLPRIIDLQYAFSEIKENEPYKDKVINHIKGLVYGLMIGQIGAFSTNEQTLLTLTNQLKNSIGGTRTNIVISERYDNLWLIKIKTEIEKLNIITKKVFPDFNRNALESVLRRLHEVDTLNRERCTELEKQGKSEYKERYHKIQTTLEAERRYLYLIEKNIGVSHLIEELEQIKEDERKMGEAIGQKRKFYEKDSFKYIRKSELKSLIEAAEINPEYLEQKKKVEGLAARARDFSFGYTKYDSSIDEQFNRISDAVTSFIRSINNQLIAEKNKEKDLIKLDDMEFAFDKLWRHYKSASETYCEAVVTLPQSLAKNFSHEDLTLLKTSVNAVLSAPQGFIGSISEQRIIELIKMVGKNLPDGVAKSYLRSYFKYRTHKKSSFEFPEEGLIRNLLVFLIKTNGYDQINKMMENRRVSHKDITFLLWGAFMGFSNLPKTFTNIIFESNNDALFEHIDSFLFNKVISENMSQ